MKTTKNVVTDEARVLAITAELLRLDESLAGATKSGKAAIVSCKARLVLERMALLHCDETLLACLVGCRDALDTCRTMGDHLNSGIVFDEADKALTLMDQVLAR